jgi:hypothetical protein
VKTLHSFFTFAFRCLRCQISTVPIRNAFHNPLDQRTNRAITVFRRLTRRIHLNAIFVAQQRLDRQSISTITSQTIKLMNNYCIKLTLFGLTPHALKFWAVRCATRLGLVDIDFDQLAFVLTITRFHPSLDSTLLGIN